jgi:hypothetical protein
MMFMMPMPPTISDTSATPASRKVNTCAVASTVSTKSP